MNPPDQDVSPRSVARMFDRIAGRYDLLNRLLSFRRDEVWRDRLVRRLPETDDLRLLDLATGTGDVLLAAARRHGDRLRMGVGVDPAGNMLALAQRKFPASGRLYAVQGDGQAIPLPDDSADAVTIAFGIRNVADPAGGLREICRVLRPGGRALVLEFSMPSNRAFRAVYLAYFRHVLPRLGGAISGDTEAYTYLNRSVEAFPYGEAFCRMMTDAGFTRVEACPLTLGIATVYQGDKPSP
ncbi:MAG: bifunctional demethylmenaquinone methyltransferase/2-methoxy-6-polyprenyl-1,4-benzoquinol methylase UbiE [bacterium]|nr:bifunctional demethylmenaquinone methyltransferase/2-methoxy-6-polyprenyl-1,4-benzoquinol methylase UbiE [bacterium]